MTEKNNEEKAMSKKIKAAIIGSGNIGTDLMIKILRNGKNIEMGAMVGIDPESDGLARAARMGVATTHEGVDGLVKMPEFADIDIVFDATSAKAHYAEIVASISSKSAGPGTRANIDEFTETTSRAIEVVGGAQKGKAIIILNPAEPPLLMRDTVYVLSEAADKAEVEASVEEMVQAVNSYVPGYRLKQKVQFDDIPEDQPMNVPGLGRFSGLKTSIFLEVEGAAHYLPAYAGNLDIMTSAALGTAERIAESLVN